MNLENTIELCTVETELLFVIVRANPLVSDLHVLKCQCLWAVLNFINLALIEISCIYLVIVVMIFKLENTVVSTSFLL